MRTLVILVLGAVALVSCADTTTSTPIQAGSDTIEGSSDLQDGNDTDMDEDLDPGPGVDTAEFDNDTDTEPGDSDGGDVATSLDTTDSACKDAETGDRCENDGDPCSIELCAEGKCLPTNGVETCADVAATEPCWTFKCAPATGCVKSVFASGIACNDSNACTVDDRCQAGVKACLGDGIPADDTNPCTADTCVQGQITHSPLDGNPCSLGGAAGLCKTGVCSPDGCTAVDGGWTAWVYEPCSVPCGGGSRTGTRSCAAPSPSCGGADCDGPATTVENCNTTECGPITDVTTCPVGLPFGPNPTCLTAPASTPFAKIVNSSKEADSYGVKLVKGPAGSVAALYAQQEWFERLADDGTVLLAAVSLPVLNPAVAPDAVGDLGFPAFYGPALGFDGSQFVVARPAQSAPHIHLYAVDLNGILAIGPVTIEGPSGAIGGDQGPALEWTGDAWLVAWRVYLGGSEAAVIVARLSAALDQDMSFGQSGLVTLEGGDRHPELAISGDGATAALVSGEINFQLAILSTVTGDVIAMTPGSCPGGSAGTNGDGNDVVWNEALGEFGVLHSSQGTGNCDGTDTSTNATLLRVSATGSWIGAPLPVLCGFPIGAGFRGGIAAWPDGRYAIAMQRYHDKPYCLDPFPNGSQGTASFDLVAVDATTATTSLFRTYAGVPTTYSQADVVWTGTRMVAMTPEGITKPTAGYVFEP